MQSKVAKTNFFSNIRKIQTISSFFRYRSLKLANKSILDIQLKYSHFLLLSYIGVVCITVQIGTPRGTRKKKYPPGRYELDIFFGNTLRIVETFLEAIFTFWANFFSLILLTRGRFGLKFVLWPNQRFKKTRNNG